MIFKHSCKDSYRLFSVSVKFVIWYSKGGRNYTSWTTMNHNAAAKNGEQLLLRLLISLLLY